MKDFDTSVRFRDQTLVDAADKKSGKGHQNNSKWKSLHRRVWLPFSGIACEYF